jgi:hypothetical protein
VVVVAVVVLVRSLDKSRLIKLCGSKGGESWSWGQTLVIIVVAGVVVVTVLCMTLLLVSWFFPIGQSCGSCRLVAGPVSVVIVSNGTLRYELQNVVAGAPRYFRIVRAKFVTLQLAARFLNVKFTGKQRVNMSSSQRRMEICMKYDLVIEVVADKD